MCKFAVHCEEANEESHQSCRIHRLGGLSRLNLVDEYLLAIKVEDTWRRIGEVVGYKVGICSQVSIQVAFHNYYA